MTKLFRNVLIGGVISAIVVPKIMKMKSMHKLKSTVTKKAKILNKTGRQLKRNAFKTLKTAKSIMT